MSQILYLFGTLRLGKLGSILLQQLEEASAALLADG
jgi:hypothetical protein